MSAKSKSSSARTNRGAEVPAGPPPSADAIRQAEQLVDGYAILIERHDDGLYYGRGLEYPYLLGHGKTPAAAHRMAREGLIAAVAADISIGNAPPLSSSEKRTQQINVRVSPMEKLRIEEVARRKGFRGVGDFLRSAALTAD